MGRYQNICEVLKTLKDHNALNPVIDVGAFKSEVNLLLKAHCSNGGEECECGDCKIKQICLLSIYLKIGLRGSIIWQAGAPTQ